MKATWTKIAVAATLSAISIAAIAQTPPPAPQPGHPARRGQHKHHAIAWSRAEGKPMFQAGHSVGFYIWHEGNTVYVVTTSESDKGVKFGGRIMVQDGGIADLKGMKDEKVDHFKQPKPNVVEFHFQTHEATDGIKFNISGGKHIRFMLKQEGHKTEHIFYGAKAIEAEHDPVIFDLSK